MWLGIRDESDGRDSALDSSSESHRQARTVPLITAPSPTIPAAIQISLVEAADQARQQGEPNTPRGTTAPIETATKCGTTHWGTASKAELALPRVGPPDFDRPHALDVFELALPPLAPEMEQPRPSPRRSRRTSWTA